MLSTRFTQHSLVTEAHKTIRPYLTQKSISIDATMGNGHDTLFLAQHSRKVYAFDIQKSAIMTTQTRLEKAHCDNNVSLIHAGHESMQQHINSKDNADVILFNLGYLPHADSTIITLQQNTITALNQALLLLNQAGIISILAYPGHDGGLSEMLAIIDWYEQLARARFAVTIIHRSEDLITSGSLTQDFYSFSRRSNRRIASYATIATTRKTDKKTSQNPEVIQSSLHSLHENINSPRLFTIQKNR